MPSDRFQLSARAFLQRARSHLAAPGLEYLLYAALDVRFGIEARLHEYLDAAEEVASLKKRGWQVEKLARGLDQAYGLGDKVASLAILDEKGGRPTVTFLYTPVNRRARQIAERLGDYLHYTERFKPNDQGWVDAFRTLVAEGLDRLADATTGTLLSPVLRQGEADAMVLAEVPEGVSIERARTMLGTPGQTIVFRIDYLDAIPSIDAA